MILSLGAMHRRMLFSTYARFQTISKNTTFIPIFFFTFMCWNAHSAPLLSEPKFIQLSTEFGLSQDTVNAMLIDKDGFLWIGTDTGLNRFDGYRVLSVSGLNNEFSDALISSLLMDSTGMLWVSTSNGVYRFNPTDGAAELIINSRQALLPDWYEEASNIIEHGNKIWFSMTESIQYFDLQTQQLHTFYALNEDELSKEYTIRHVWVDDDLILMATTDGLFGFKQNTPHPVLIDHLVNHDRNIDSLNSKFLYVESDLDKVWLGTVEGLFSLPLSGIKDYILKRKSAPRSSLQVRSRNIWHIASLSDEKMFLATDKGLYSFHKPSSQLTHLLRPTDSRGYLSSDIIFNFAFDDAGNMWLGTRSDGALYWSPKTTLFNNIFNVNGGRGNKILSDNNVWGVETVGDEQLWLATDNGITLYNLEDGSTEHYLTYSGQRSQYSTSNFFQVLSDRDQGLWLFSGQGLLYFDLQSKKIKPIPLFEESNREVVDSFAWGGFVDRDNRLWFINDLGFYRYSPDSKKLEILSELKEQIQPSISRHFMGYMPNQANQLVLAVNGVTWLVDVDTFETEVLHALPTQGNLSKVWADSYVEDRNGILWLAYPGYGLVGFDVEDKQARYFYDKNNLLATSNIFGLQEDEKGNVWMGSYAGLLKFNPDTQHVLRFGHVQGLVNVEFNQGATARLADDRLAYGSPKGITLFSPQSFSQEIERHSNTRIADIRLSTKDIQFPLQDLSGQTISLKHDDLGLEILFSTIEFEYQNSIRYRYHLQGEENIEYPVTNDPKVMFPKLSPGNYTFEVSAFDAASGEEGQPARVYIKVDYAPWASPLAYIVYSLIVFSILMSWLLKRRVNTQALAKAHRSTLQSQQRLHQALAASNSHMWEWQSLSNRYYAPRIAEDLGFQNEDAEVYFEDFVKLIHPQDRAAYMKNWQRFIVQEKASFDITYRLLNAEKDVLWFRDVGSMVTNQTQTIVTGTYTNITDSISAKENLKLFGEAFQHTSDWVLIYDHEYKLLAVNDALKDQLGTVEDEDVNTDIAQYFPLESESSPEFLQQMKALRVGESWQGNDELRLTGNQEFQVRAYTKAIANVNDAHTIAYYLAIITDVTEQRVAEQKLINMANFDGLTGLPNRTLLLDRVAHAIDNAKRNGETVTLLFIDLDRFKPVNDTFGHQAGDTLLKVISERLLTLLRKNDTVSRLGGDEFVVMIEKCCQPNTVSTLANKIIECIEQPVSIGAQSVSVSSSIGVAVYPNDATTSDQLLRNADIAMYHAKDKGRNNFQFFTQQMNEIAAARLTMENNLKEAHALQVFENYYQPIFCVTAQRIVGVELLLRWPTESGMIPPDQFIPIAEEVGLIEAMTWDAITRALPVLLDWQKQAFGGYISVNLSARHFDGSIAIEKIVGMLHELEIPIEMLRFEITESALMKDYEKALAYMQRMKELGFVIALDDFGTGYSSLKYLKEFPIDIIKIDKSFVDDIGINKNNEAIILTTISMAESLGMYCIAEGIEQENQVNFFKETSCSLLQGYFYSKPVPAEKLAPLFASP